MSYNNNEVSLLEPLEKIVIESMNEGVVILECNGHIFSLNPAAERILNLKNEEVRSKSFEHIFSANSANEDLIKIIDRLIYENQDTINQEIIYTRPDGQRIDLAVSSAFLEIDACQPDMQNSVLVLRDITPLKSLERVRRKAIDHLSHELKTPIAIIQASIGILAENVEPQEKFKKSLGRIQRNLDRLKEIQVAVQEILTPWDFRPRHIDVHSFITETLNRITDEAAHRNVKLVNQIEQFETDLLDPDLIEVILGVLVKNAIENTPDEGEITVRLQRQESGLLLEVKDSGVGIRLEDQGFIFNGFHHTQETDDYSSKRPYDFDAGGKGLELLRLKILSEEGLFDISFESSRCQYIPSAQDHCPGLVSSCSHIKNHSECARSGGTTFSIMFRI